MGAADGVGMLDVGNQITGAHHVGKRGTHVAQRGLDSAQDEEGLPVWVTDGHGLAVVTRCGGTGNEYQVSRAYRRANIRSAPPMACPDELRCLVMSRPTIADLAPCGRALMRQRPLTKAA